MNLMLDSFWRAAAYCLHPRVIGLSVLPLVVMIVVAAGLGYFYWEPAVRAVGAWLDASSVLSTVVGWLQGLGLADMRPVLAPLVVVLAVTPAVVVLALVLVALVMMPALVALVSDRRFPTLEKRQGGSFVVGLFWSLGSAALALLALVVSVPLWLVPPLVLVLPPLIWGWLTYRVMTYDALALHASAEERRELIRRHRGRLVVIGIITGYLGAAPSIVWASGWIFLAGFFLLIPVAIWVYTLVFAFSSLWFAHYALAALESLRAQSVSAPAPAPVAPAPLALADANEPRP